MIVVFLNTVDPIGSYLAVERIHKHYTHTHTHTHTNTTRTHAHTPTRTHTNTHTHNGRVTNEQKGS